jgi:predicted GNAT family acetyltransferase
MIKHEEMGNHGAFFYERDDHRLAAMTYSRTTPELIIIDHTEVSDELRGQSMGRQLLNALVAWARESGTKVRATCPYALAQFKKDESIRDVFAG